eukprot:8548576-Pyramimonas_sp.AAC.1
MGVLGLWYGCMMGVLGLWYGCMMGVLGLWHGCMMGVLGLWWCGGRPRTFRVPPVPRRCPPDVLKSIFYYPDPQIEA